MGYTIFDVVHELTGHFYASSLVLLALCVVVFFGQLIELPFLQLRFRFNAVDFLRVRHIWEREGTICFTCSGVIPGDVGCRVI